MEISRCFIAVPVENPALGTIRRLMRELEGQTSDVKWVRDDQMHITIKFLGEVDNRELPKVCEKLREACVGMQPFSVKLSGVGSFPKDKPPRVVWVGVDEGEGILRELNERLEASLLEIGIAGEMRGFNPHLTLGRVGKGTDLDQLANVMQSQAKFTTHFDVDVVQVIESIRERNGMLYESIDTVEL